MLDGDATIARRITNFRFDNATHFAPDMYDEAWLFGIETGPGIDATELRSISDFMNGGGGVFATGDHGALGKAMGGEIPRVRSMRLWDHTSANSDLDEVSMMERRRNDTNRPGHVTSRPPVPASRPSPARGTVHEWLTAASRSGARSEGWRAEGGA